MPHHLFALSLGAVLRNDVAGKVLMKCKLSDMPELRRLQSYTVCHQHLQLTVICLSAFCCCPFLGAVLRNDVAGKVLMKCKLSDMPELRLGLNEALEDVTFHQCVNLGAYEANKVVTFIPPDGEFELMR
jgi:hypothetical protein